MKLTHIYLERFCGFEKFETDLSDFTVFVGPNNGGKTTILRAVKFALDAFRILFGPREHPNLHLLTKDFWSVDLTQIAGRLAIADYDLVYYLKNRQNDATIRLSFAGFSTDVMMAVNSLGRANNVEISVFVGSANLISLPPKDKEGIANELYTFAPQFIPPPGTISAVEEELGYGQLQNQLATGHVAETWRNQLHWAIEGEDPEIFQRAVARVRAYVPDAQLRPPRRSRTSKNIAVNYVERGVELDISASGGGLRTLVTLAAAIELSKETVLLFDEPDSHLHSSVQRQVAHLLKDAAGDNCQILVATHAPDFIDEVPVESLVWVDKSDSKGRTCSNTGKILVDLGALSKTRAMELLGANALLFFEGKTDHKTLALVMETAGKGDTLKRVRVERLHGFGAIDKLPGLVNMVKALGADDLTVAVVRDADYTTPLPHVDVKKDGDVLIAKLPCKELENLVLLSPECIEKACAAAAESRSSMVDDEVAPPALDAINRKIDEISVTDEIKDKLRPHWLCAWGTSEGKDIRKNDAHVQGAKRFEKYWSDSDWRRRCCPGKTILKKLQDWIQKEFKISLSLSLLFSHYDPPEDIKKLLDALEEHFAEVKP